MTKRHSLATSCVSLLLGWCCMLSPAHSADIVLDSIVAVVNDGVVLESDVTAETRQIRLEAQSAGQSLPAEPVLRERVLERLVDREIQRQRAAEIGVAIDANSVNRAVERVARSNNMDNRQFREALIAQGFDYEQFRRNIEQELLFSRLLQREVEPRLHVSEQEIDDFLAAEQNQAAARRRYRLQHILVAIPTSATTDQVESARDTAEGLRQRILEGADFAEVAAAESDGARALQGGDLGWRTLQEVPDFLAAALVDMQPGDVSPPLQSPNGLHLVRLNETEERQAGTRRETLARHLFIADALDAESRLVALRGRIIAGESFATLAERFSEDPNSASLGGELPWFGRGQMPAELEQMADALRPGELSAPFRTQFGWHLLEVLDRREREVDEDALRRQAENTLRQRKLEQETERWVRQLRDESFVEFPDADAG